MVPISTPGMIFSYDAEDFTEGGMAATAQETQKACLSEVLSIKTAESSNK